MTGVSCRAEGSRFDILQSAEQVRSNLSADVPSLGKFFSFPSSCARKNFLRSWSASRETLGRDKDSVAGLGKKE